MAMSADIPISELIQRCKQGEQSAREQLFHRYRHYLRLLAEAQLGRYLRVKCDPSDLVQQTLLEAHRDFAGFNGQHERDLLAWLRRILAHNLFNEARRYGAQQRAANREISLEQMQTGIEQSSLALRQCLAAETPTPSQLAAQREADVLLADTLARLPADYQTVLLLRIFEGLPAEEVAQRMNRSAGAVRMLQLRALTALREEMNESQ
jgi:RNA polymerase sigma-70 factor (ECF subfamily)